MAVTDTDRCPPPSVGSSTSRPRLSQRLMGKSSSFSTSSSSFPYPFFILFFLLHFPLLPSSFSLFFFSFISLSSPSLFPPHFSHLFPSLPLLHLLLLLLSF